MHDLDRVLGVCHHFGVPAMVCINKFDLNDDNTRQIESYCLEQEVDVVSRIPFNNIFTEALVHKQPVVEYMQGEITGTIKSLWQRITHTLEMKRR
jgi:MinD superfamily P-loop ATPase